MPCEYNADLCFIRPSDWGTATLLDEAGVLVKDLFKGAKFTLEPSEEEKLEVVVARVNGLAMWGSEEELLDWLDRTLPESWWVWLAGYKIEVIPKVDAGPCRIKKRGT